MTGIGAHIIQYWHAAEQPPDIAAAISSFAALNPECRHRCFDEVSAARLIGERFGDRHLAAFRRCAVPAMQADYFRYCAILCLGGFYVDADTRCLAPLAPLLAGADAGVLFLHPNGNVINGFFGFAEPEHPFLQIALEVATRNIETQVSNSVWTVTGPSIFSALHYVAGMADGEAYSEYGPDPEFHAVMQTAHDCALRAGRKRTEIFDGLRLNALDTLFAYISDIPVPAYKTSSNHWLHWQGSIFR
jgi:hypothetical protein